MYVHFHYFVINLIVILVQSFNGDVLVFSKNVPLVILKAIIIIYD
jgi:hypothetical protein